MSTIKAYAATEASGELKPFEYDPGTLDAHHIEVKVISCGICHSDLSMLKNDWGMTTYPFVPGHEVVGEIIQVGEHVPNLKVGQKIGIGWNSESCMHCQPCLSGDHNLCRSAEGIIVGRHGGFADKVRVHWAWATPLPDSMDSKKAGPLFCGGITVFNPFVQLNIKPTDKVGVVGIGGLGHLAIQFANKWGCEVTAFSSTPEKSDLAKKLGAHKIVNSRSDDELAKIAGTLDLILVTVNVSLNWAAYVAALSVKGKLHVVGAAPEPMPISAFSLLEAQKSVSGSPIGSPATVLKMVEFCDRHNIEPMTETFKMSEVNEAMKYLADGKPRFRIVLENDF